MTKKEVIGFQKEYWVKWEIRHYHGSLDYPCTICHSNSYNNYHILRQEQVWFVFCLKCFNKVKSQNDRSVQDAKR